MAPTSRVVHDEIDNLLDYLVYSEIALHANPVRNEGGRVSWRGFAPYGKFLESREPESVATYRAWLEAGAYSALLFDGALLQVTYDFVGHHLIAHRLAWVPCPFMVDLELLQLESPLEIVDLYAAGNAVDVVLRTTIRFDYDIEGGGNADHPAAHLSVNSSECRIACAAPLRLGHFVDFVFRNFYPDFWRAHPYLGGLSRKAWGPHTVTDEETNRLHVSWRR